MTHRPYQADIQDILAENFVPEGWLNANVPEEIHATLRRAGAIRGNTYDKREDEERWIEEKRLDLLQKVLCSRHGKNKKRHPAL